MKVGLITPPIIGHTIRGTGVYARELTKALKEYTDAEVLSDTFSAISSKVDLYHFPYFCFFLSYLSCFSFRSVIHLEMSSSLETHSFNLSIITN